LAVALALVCVYQLMFTFHTWSVEREARALSGGDYQKEQNYLDSIKGEVVYNFFWLRKYTYSECKEREITLGLDLEGGLNVILEVSVSDVVKSLANNSTDPVFQEALKRAKLMQMSSQEDFVTLFGRAFEEVAPDAKLASVFSTVELRDQVKFNSTNAQVLQVIRRESDAAVDNAFNIIRTRIDKFGVVSPNIQQLETKGRILVELPGVREPERVRKLLQGSANLEFWETYEFSELFQYFNEANAKIKDIRSAQQPSTIQDSISASAAPSLPAPVAGTQASRPATADSAQVALLNEIQPDSVLPDSSGMTDLAVDYPLYAILTPYLDEQNMPMPGDVVGVAHQRDTARVNAMLNHPQVRALFPRNVKFLWNVKPFDAAGTMYHLHAIKVTGADGRAPLTGDVVVSARAEFDAMRGSAAKINMSMNGEGARTWARITKDNVGRFVAVVLDNYVYSDARVTGEIPGGNTEITGNYTINEATDLANVLKSGKMPAAARIVQEELVGPSMGKEAIQAGLISFALALVVVLGYLAFYYSTAGLVADIALLANMFLLMGVMASVGAVLTLPGIAGIVLTLGMADDANVIIFERIREELRAGKALRTAIADGYKNAYSAIIDGQLTTFIVAVVLFFFGTGPIRGFATTLVLGIFTSLFCSIFITRLIFERMVDRNMVPKFSIPTTENVFVGAKYDFIGWRKKLYGLSIAVILIGVFSMVFQGFNYGIDFTGGRSYVVRFDQSVNTSQLQESLRASFDENVPEVKTFGADNQVKITTDYLMNVQEEDVPADSLVQFRLYEGVQHLLPEGTTYDTFCSDTYLQNTRKVGPTISDDIKRAAVVAVILSLIGMFLYIFLRFKNWRFGLGAVISVFHDTLIMITLYTLLHKVMPFSLEIDQNFIAAVLTVIGYSINDTVIIYDRIREYTTLYPKRSRSELYNAAMNSTLGRTMNTSLTTILVLLVMFIWGGEVIRGFTFAMMFGITVGTYSSVFNAAPIVFDLFRIRNKSKN